MKNLKLFFSVLTVIFSILVLTKSFSTNVLMPLMFISLIMTLLITAKEYYDNKEKTMAIYFLLLSIFLFVVTIYNVISLIWNI